MLVFTVVWCLLAGAATSQDGLPTDRPLIIAHRGSSGMRPEHTVAAYQLAIEQGADVIECDVVLTKDLQLVCSHDISINSTTDVHLHPEFSDRIRTYSYDGSRVTDYFTVDFTLAELKTLRRIQQNPDRDQSYNGLFPIATFDEYVAVAKNASNPRTIGIYPETKRSPFINQILTERNETRTFEDILLSSLTRHGYTSATSPCFIQTFYPSSILNLTNKTQLRLVMLTFAAMPESALTELEKYCYGVAPKKNAIVKVVNNYVVETTDLVDRIHAHGMKVHTFTFSNEDSSLAWNYGADPYREYETFVKLGVDGFFTDYPWSLANYLNMSTGEVCNAGHSSVNAGPTFVVTLCSLVCGLLFLIF